MSKTLSFFCLFFVSVLLFSASLIPVSAESVSGVGYIEYQTEASINFEEVVEVILINKETGHYYTQKLHRINDYSANVSVPFGVYDVTARVLSDTNALLSDYSVVCLADEISVTNSHTATVVPLRVDEFASGDVSEDAYPYYGENLVGNDSLSDDEINVAELENIDNTMEQEELPKGEKKDRSFVASLVVTLLVFIAIAVSLYFVMNKLKS